MNLDDLLKEYVGQEPPLGMEGRILRRCQRRSWGWPAFGLAMAAGLVCLIWLRPPAVGPVRGGVRQHLAVVEDAGQKPGGRAEPLPHKKNRESGGRALWRFAQRHPEAALSLTVEYKPEPVVPLQIEPIAIEELGDIQR